MKIKAPLLLNGNRYGYVWEKGISNIEDKTLIEKLCSRGYKVLEDDVTCNEVAKKPATRKKK